MTTHYLTVCHEPGCGNRDLLIGIDYDVTDDDPPAPSAFYCGACMNEITDVTEGSDNQEETP